MNMIGHGNRVYAAQFFGKDDNVFVTAGWDQNFLIWDTREAECVSMFEGVKVSGDALDFKQEKILAG